jgi:hypothetical protein
MTLQDQIDAFQKLIFSHFQSGTHNECRISALVPLVQESYGIYKFITSMLRAMHTSMLLFPISPDCGCEIADYLTLLKPLVMMKPLNRSAAVTMPSTTVLSDSITSAPTSVILPV